MAAYNSTTDLAGQLAYVATVDGYFLLDKVGGITADGITVVDGTPVGAQWQRLVAPTPRWQQQLTWFIDPLLGNDENDGETDGAPIQSWAELLRRIGTPYVTPPGDVTITVIGDLDEPVYLDVVRGTGNGELPGGRVYLQSPLTVVAETTLASVTETDPLSNIIGSFTTNSDLFSGADFMSNMLYLPADTAFGAVILDGDPTSGAYTPFYRREFPSSAAPTPVVGATIQMIHLGRLNDVRYLRTYEYGSLIIMGLRLSANAGEAVEVDGIGSIFRGTWRFLSGTFSACSTSDSAGYTGGATVFSGFFEGTVSKGFVILSGDIYVNAITVDVDAVLTASRIAMPAASQVLMNSGSTLIAQNPSAVYGDATFFMASNTSIVRTQTSSIAMLADPAVVMIESGGDNTMVDAVAVGGGVFTPAAANTWATYNAGTARWINFASGARLDATF